MTTIDKSGYSIEEIIRQFRREHNIRDHELKYEVLKKPSKGFLGLFASKIALVRFQVPEAQDRASLFTESLLQKMGVSFDRVISKMEGKTLYLTIDGIGDPGFVIGKNGSMLETLQYLVNRVFEDDKKLDRIFLDADGYRERREEQFLRQFLPLISKIKTQGKSLTLDPMSAGERRIIHRHIERDRGLRTLTIGEGENKRIVIFSAKMKESDVLSQNKPKVPPANESKLRSPEKQTKLKEKQPKGQTNSELTDNEPAAKPKEKQAHTKDGKPRFNNNKAPSDTPRPQGEKKHRFYKPKKKVKSEE